jgi:hypothetical protein
MLRPLVKNVLRSTPNSEVWLMSLTIGAGLPFVDRDPRQSTSGAHMQAVECAEDPDPLCHCILLLWMAGDPGIPRRIMGPS